MEVDKSLLVGDKASPEGPFSRSVIVGGRNFSMIIVIEYNAM